MPTPKTEATELSVGFGLLGISDPINYEEEIETLFGGTLLQTTYKNYLAEFLANRPLYSRFIQLGLALRRTKYPTTGMVQWTGPQAQASTVTGAKDLFIPGSNMPISVKNESNVVANLSPYNFFKSLPSGTSVASKSNDWFIEKDLPDLQALFKIGQAQYPYQLHESVIDYYATTSREERKNYQNYIGTNLNSSDKTTFYQLYRQMCTKVAILSAEEFNHNLASLAANIRPAVRESLTKQFFRINAVPYILTGLDRKSPFAVLIPDITSWRRQWSLVEAIAEPSPNRGQSIVNIKLTFLRKSDRVQFEFNFHVEIRWSHGKFCGNPEGKLYKEFNWTYVPFFEKITL